MRRYVERQGESCFADTRPSQSRRRLAETARDVHFLAEHFGESDAAALKRHELLARVFHEQCEIVDGSDTSVALRPPRTTKCGGVISPADPDARYNKHRGTAYLVQIMETFAEDDARPGRAGSGVGRNASTRRTSCGVARRLRPGLKVMSGQGARRGVHIISPPLPAQGAEQGKLTLEDGALQTPDGHGTSASPWNIPRDICGDTACARSQYSPRGRFPQGACRVLRRAHAMGGAELQQQARGNHCSGGSSAEHKPRCRNSGRPALNF